jgi:hypothetical protein
MEADWQVWAVRAAVAAVFGATVLATDRILSRVKGWRKWVAFFGVPLVVSLLAITFVSTDTGLSRSVPEGFKLSVLVISFLFGFVCFIGFSFSFLRWIDSWEGQSKRNRKSD